MISLRKIALCDMLSDEGRLMLNALVNDRPQELESAFPAIVLVVAKEKHSFTGCIRVGFECVQDMSGKNSFSHAGISANPQRPRSIR